MKTDKGKINIKDVTSDNSNTFSFLYQIIQSICLILGGLLYFINIYKSKIKKELLIIQTMDVNIELTKSNDNYNKVKRKLIIRNKFHYCKNLALIILMPLFLVFYNLGIAYGVKHPQLEKRIYFLFFITLINVIIIKKQIYKHQKLSLVITAIGIIPVIISFFSYLEKENYNFSYDIMLLIGSFCYSLYLVFIKYITLNKGMSAFLLLLIQGLLCFIYTIIIFCIISYYNKGDMTYITNIFICNSENYICISHFYANIIIFIILNTILQTLIFLVI